MTCTQSLVPLPRGVIIWWDRRVFNFDMKSQLSSILAAVKRQWVPILAAVTILSTVSFLFVRDNRRYHLRMCRIALHSAFHNWERAGRPDGDGVRRAMDGWGGFKPYVFVNELRVGTNTFKTLFATLAERFGENGLLCITEDGRLILLQDGRLVLFQDEGNVILEGIRW